jgi:hypothetical protein
MVHPEAGYVRYDPLCAGQDQAEPALGALLSLVTLVVHMSGLLLGLAIPGLGQKEERRKE